MSYTRAQLRRKFGHLTGQPFFRLFGVDNGTASAGGTTTTLIDTVLLKDENNFWRGQYLYLPTTDKVRRLSGSTQSSGTITWLAPLTGATQTSDVYELWSTFAPHEVHDAINRALREAWPHFFLTAEDETLCIVEDSGLVYTLPTTNTIRRLCSVYLILYNNTTGTVTSTGTNVQLIDSAASFTSADVGKKVAIYGDGGTATGNVRTVSAVDSSTQITVSVAFSQILPAATKYRLLDVNDQFPGQVFLNNWKLDKETGPTSIWFGEHMSGFEGHLLRLVYEYEYPSLTAEASSTDCPEGYLIPATLANLYFTKQASAPAANDPTWSDLYTAAMKARAAFSETQRFRHQPSTLRHHSLGHSGRSADYPF